MPLRVAEKASLSDVGRARQGNEDSFLERSPLFAVADGMGGARAGEVASKIAVETFDDITVDGASPEEQLATVARTANKRIYELAQEDASRAGMGTTFTAAFVTGNELAIGHVGDSRLYRLRDDELERLTHDHSLVEEFVRQGKLTPEEAEVHPQRSIITRALGPEPEVQVDTFTYPGRDGDVYLACSDGLTGMISEADVKEILSGRESLDDAAQKLIDAANANGGRDNITVVLWRLEDDVDSGDDPDTLGGQATQVGGIDADAVRAAVDEADGADTSQRTVPGTTQPTPMPDEESTMALSAEEAQAARSGSSGTRDSTQIRTQMPPATDAPERVSDPGTRGAPRRAPPAAGRSRGRKAIVIVIVLVMLAAAIAGVKYLIIDKVFFVGTNHSGLVTLYKGVPYDLPLGVALYTQQHVSPVPARSLCPPQRRRILDHQLRSRGDATNLVKQVESGRLQQDC
ncbi:MAG: family protein phosphatase [Thermoleophilaceae bacterium]|nr:family protein phosphatase [Thermoleophilaceae bacterium]